MSLRGKKAIRKAFRQDKQSGQTYDEIGLSWGVSSGVAWRMINEKYYWPADKNIIHAILVEASLRGIPLGNRGGRDLWAMPPEELLWRLENREVIHDHNENTT